MDMFYYPDNNNMLLPVDHMRARILLAQKLKERAETLTDNDFAIWSSSFKNCQKFRCIEDLDNFVYWISQYDLPAKPSHTAKKRRM